MTVQVARDSFVEQTRMVFNLASDLQTATREEFSSATGRYKITSDPSGWTRCKPVLDELWGGLNDPCLKPPDGAERVVEQLRRLALLLENVRDETDKAKNECQDRIKREGRGRESICGPEHPGGRAFNALCKFMSLEELASIQRDGLKAVEELENAWRSYRRYPFSQDHVRRGTSGTPVLSQEPMTAPSTARSVFIIYAHADNENADPKKCWLDRFVKFLKPFVRQDDFTVFSDRDIRIGDDWHAHIQAHLMGAKAAVLLVSPDFLASDYIANSELPPLLKEAADRGVRIFPIVISPCSFSRTKFKYPDPKNGPNEFKLSSIQSANPPSKTLVEMEEGQQNRVLTKVAEQLADLLATNG